MLTQRDIEILRMLVSVEMHTTQHSVIIGSSYMAELKAVLSGLDNLAKFKVDMSKLTVPFDKVHVSGDGGNLTARVMASGGGSGSNVGSAFQGGGNSGGGTGGSGFQGGGNSGGGTGGSGFQGGGNSGGGQPTPTPKPAPYTYTCRTCERFRKSYWLPDPITIINRCAACQKDVYKDDPA